MTWDDLLEVAVQRMKDRNASMVLGWYVVSGAELTQDRFAIGRFAVLGGVHYCVTVAEQGEAILVFQAVERASKSTEWEWV
jgi:hypothetical protein